MGLILLEYQVSDDEVTNKEEKEEEEEDEVCARFYILSIPSCCSVEIEVGVVFSISTKV